MSGHCDFCGVWHSGSCCHPGRAQLEELRRQLAEADGERDRLKHDAAERDAFDQRHVAITQTEWLDLQKIQRELEAARADLESSEAKLALAEQDSRRLDWFTEKIPLITRCGGYWFVSTDATTVEQFDNVRDAIDAAIAAGEGKS